MRGRVVSGEWWSDGVMDGAYWYSSLLFTSSNVGVQELNAAEKWTDGRVTWSSMVIRGTKWRVTLLVKYINLI